MKVIDRILHGINFKVVWFADEPVKEPGIITYHQASFSAKNAEKFETIINMLDLAKGLIEKIVSDTQTEISVNRIQDEVCNYFGITKEIFLSRTRKREIVQARQIAMYLSRNLTKTSLSSIGAQLGGKDHATVLHACNTVSDLVDTDRSFRGFVRDIERLLTESE